MRKFIIVAATAASLAGLAAGASSFAQPAGGPPGAGPGGGGGPGWMRGDGDGWHHRGPGWHGRWHEGREHAGRPFNPRDFALLPRVEDKKLGTADVQRIAEAMLIWMGNRTWKVTDVKEAADNRVSFALALPEGGVVARFSMDRTTGRLHREG